MRKNLITFANITKIYNEIYFESSKYRIQQKVITEQIRRIISKLDDIYFKKFLEHNGLDTKEELKFFKKAIKPINAGETKFGYKTFCFIIIIIIISREKNYIIEEIEKNSDNIKFNKIELKQIIDKKKVKIIHFCRNEFKDSKKRAIKRKKISSNDKIRELNKYRDIRKQKFSCFINNGMDLSFQIIIYYIEFLRFKSRYIDFELANEFSKIISMNYSSKCRLKEKINKLVLKEIERNRD